MTEARFATGGLMQTDRIPVSPRAGRTFAWELAGDSEDTASIVQALRTLWAGKWIVLLVAALAAAAAAVHVYWATPLYTAAARIVLETEQKTVVDLQGIASSNPAEQQAMNTELLVLRSPELMAGVVEALALENDPEFNRALRPPPAWRRVIAHLSTLGTRGLGGSSRPGTAADQSSAAVVRELLRKVRASIVPNTYAFEVSVETESAAKSAAIANTIAEHYVANQRAEKFDAMEQALGWLSDRVVELKQSLEAAEAETEAYASRASTVNEQTLAANMRRLQSMRERQQAQVAAAENLQARLGKLEALRGSRAFARVSETAEDRKLRVLASDLTAAPEDAELVAQFDSRLAGLAETLRREADRLERRSAAIAEAIAELEGDVERQSADLVNLRQLRREAEATRLLYKHFLARMKEISVQQGVQNADSRLLSRAKAPGRASSPKVTRTIVMGGLGGLVIGFGLVLLRDRLRTTVRSPEELESVSGESVIGILPEAAAREPRRLLGGIIDNPRTGFAEAVRNLRASICLSGPQAPPKVVMVSSSEPEEGKSTIAAALALTSAMAGNRVLLIDADLRRRALKEFFGVDGRRGLVSLVGGEVSREEAILHDERTAIDLLIAEDDTSHSSDFFESIRFEFFVQDMRKEYDLVIIDTPPVLVVPDARVIGQSADAVVYVVRWQSTASRMVRAGLELLRQVGLPVSGLALTRIDATNMCDYGYYGYGEGRQARRFERYYAA